MRKFSVRWWSGPNLQLWRSGEYPHTFAFFPHVGYDLYSVNDPRISVLRKLYGEPFIQIPKNPPPPMINHSLEAAVFLVNA